MEKKLLELVNVTVTQNGIPALKNINLTIHAGEQWAITGGSGSGKTSLAHAIAGSVFYRGLIQFYFDEGHIHPHIAVAEQQHRFRNLSHTSDFYYQQRFNSPDAEDAITVKEELLKHDDGSSNSHDWINVLHLTKLMDEPLIQLSNGENKRLQLVRILLDNPQLIILDNPFTGLDAEGRETLQKVIDTVIQKGVHVLLICNLPELPGSITHVAVLKSGQLIYAGTKENIPHSIPEEPINTFTINTEKLNQLNSASEDFSCAVKMKNVNVSYGERMILQNINWLVKKGECWSVSGHNGAGKSTLLSLITADNPQAYGNEIYLFDKRRGKGESIWDIKKRIGYISPELHLYFERSATCFEVIASGLFDTIGLFRKLSVIQEEQADWWADVMQLKPLYNKPLYQLSLSQQRMVLLARALVKTPPLLILDEPCQGLDTEQAYCFNQLVNMLCTNFGTTLIYVSHYEKDIPPCVNHFLRLENGKQV
ncbi:MAG: ATP-binding cassette domain-containing protein [Chitinophagaceae bacterium]|nr:ATP-binding cassette domain-containing protein [Chitinophagaceae bacterium]